MNDKEKLVQWMMKRGYATGHGDTMEDLLRELAWQMDERIKKAVEKEREECAEIEVKITVPHRDYSDMSPKEIYEEALMDATLSFRNAIRALGEKNE